MDLGELWNLFADRWVRTLATECFSNSDAVHTPRTNTRSGQTATASGQLVVEGTVAWHFRTVAVTNTVSRGKGYGSVGHLD